MFLVLPAPRLRKLLEHPVLAHPEHPLGDFVPPQILADPLLEFSIDWLSGAWAEAHERGYDFAISGVG